MDETPDLAVRHSTKYAYDRPVTFGPHRLMLRPRDSFDLRIIKTGLTIDPAATLSWRHDVYGNSVAWATFSRPSSTLVIESELLIRRYDSTSPRLTGQSWIGGAPVAYTDQERFILAPFITSASADEDGGLRRFAEGAVALDRPGAGHPLLDLSQSIHNALSYGVRFEEGTQHPLETLRLGRGSCRDYAWLFVEAARQLGYASRFVTGYLHNIASTSVGGVGALTASVGYSHAWAEAYVPGDGWVEFDPTNLLVADRQLIRVAVTRTPQEASPVSGSFSGPGSAAPVDVQVTISPVAIVGDALSASTSVAA